MTRFKPANRFVTRIRSAALVVLALGAVARAAPMPLNAPQAEGAHARPGPQAAPVPAAPPSRSPKVDRYGDPLPSGAAMRLGTVRFRHDQSIDHVVYAPDGRSVVTGDGERRLQVWDARDGKKLRQIDVGIEAVRDFAFSPDGKTIAAVGFQYEPARNLVVHYLTLTDAASGRPIRRGEWDERGDIRGIAYAPDGKTVVTASTDGTLRLWDVATASMLHQERPGELNYPSIAFSPDAASHLLAISGERTISLWDVANHRHVRQLAIDGNHRPGSLAFSPDGTTLATGLSGERRRSGCGASATAPRSGASRVQADTHVYHLAFSPDGKVLAANGHDGRLMLIDVETRKERNFSAVGRLADGPLVFSPDGRTLAATGGRMSSISGTRRRARTTWPLPKPTRVPWPPSHSSTTVGRSSPAATTGPSGSGTWPRDDHRKSSPRTAGSGPSRSPPTGRCSPRIRPTRDGGRSICGISSPASEFASCLWVIKAGLLLRGMALDGDGSSVVAAWSDGSLQRWDVSTGAERPTAGRRRRRKPGPIVASDGSGARSNGPSSRVMAGPSP